MQSYLNANSNIQNDYEGNITIPLLSKKSKKEKIDQLIGKLQYRPSTKNDAEILLALSQVIWSIEDYFDAIENEKQKELESRVKKSSFTNSGIFGSIGTGLLSVATGASAIFYSSPVLRAIKNQIINVAKNSGELLSNYTAALSNIKNQFANAEIPNIQQLCNVIDPNPVASNQIYPQIETNFVNGNCRLIFQNYLDDKIQLRKLWVHSVSDITRMNRDCDHYLMKIIRILINPYYFFDYNCSDKSPHNRIPIFQCQRILDNFCQDISPYASVNSFPPFFNTTYGHTYMNDPVNGSCSSVYSAGELYNCTMGYLANNISQSCEAIRSNYCNTTAEMLQQNQTLFGQLNALNESNKNNTILYNVLIGAASFSAFLASSYLLTKVYFKCKYNFSVDSDDPEPIVLDDSLFKEHSSSIELNIKSLIDLTELENAPDSFSRLFRSKNNLKLSDLKPSLDNVNVYLNVQQLNTLIPVLKLYSEYYTDLLRLKSFISIRAMGLFSIEPNIVKKITDNFIKVSSLDYAASSPEVKTTLKI